MSDPADLTTLAAVRLEQQRPAGSSTDQDAIIASLITQASKSITVWCAREFVPTDAATRTFESDQIGNGLLSVRPYDLRVVTAMTVDPDPCVDTVTSPLAIASTDYKLFPVPARDGVYGAIRVKSTYAASVGAPHRRFSVTGNWGFASVPGDVERACIITVNEWLRDRWMRDPGMTVELAAAGMPEVARPSALPFAARALLGEYRREEL